MFTISPMRTLPGRLYVVGAGSRIFQGLSWTDPYDAVAGRIGSLSQMPAFEKDSTVLIFADPPNTDEALAMITSVIGSASHSSGVKVVFISSISALYDRSDLFPSGGHYAKRKRQVERFIASSDVRHIIIRLGLVGSAGGWTDVIERSHLAVFPTGFNSYPATDMSVIRDQVLEAVSGQGGRAEVNAWQVRPVSGLFRKVTYVPLLETAYRSKIGRIVVKVTAKILLKVGVYLPSPDDINAFNTNFLEGVDA